MGKLFIKSCTCLHISHTINEKAPEVKTKNTVSVLPYENHTGSPHLFFKKLMEGSNILRNRYATINGNTSGKINLSERHTIAVIIVIMASVLSKGRLFIKSSISIAIEIFIIVCKIKVWYSQDEFVIYVIAC